VNVLGHNNIAQHYQSITAAHAFKNLKKQITPERIIEKWYPPVAAEGKEMQIVSAVEAVQAFGHF
jgi:hypothetical protein